MATKVCKACGAEKPLTDYGKYRGRNGHLYRRTCSPCRSKAQAKRYAENPETKARMKATAAAHHLKKSYGLTREEVDAIAEQQGGKCCICQEIPDKLHVDHCHTNGHVRGLLCGPCNRGLGMFKDDTSRLQSAIQYLKERNE